MIGRLLGHTQVSTTQRYAHLDVDPLRELVAKVGAVVDGAQKVLQQGCKAFGDGIFSAIPLDINEVMRPEFQAELEEAADALVVALDELLGHSDNPLGRLLRKPHGTPRRPTLPSTVAASIVGSWHWANTASLTPTPMIELAGVRRDLRPRSGSADPEALAPIALLPLAPQFQKGPVGHFFQVGRFPPYFFSPMLQALNPDYEIKVGGVRLLRFLIRSDASHPISFRPSCKPLSGAFHPKLRFVQWNMSNSHCLPTETRHFQRSVRCFNLPDKMLATRMTAHGRNFYFFT